jgi:predicted Zn-dependent peptidase
VQADRTADSISSIIGLSKDLLGPKKVTPEELKLSVASETSVLPGQFQTSDAVLAAMQSNALYGRPDNYYETIAAKYQALTPGAVDQALAQLLDPNALVFVVVGDAATVKPQLAKLGLPVQEMQAR